MAPPRPDSAAWPALLRFSRLELECWFLCHICLTSGDVADTADAAVHLRQYQALLLDGGGDLLMSIIR